MTPLHQAVRAGDGEQFEALLEGGADPAVRDEMGLTAELLASLLGRPFPDSSNPTIQFVEAERLQQLTAEQFQQRFGASYLAHMVAEPQLLEELYRRTLRGRRKGFFDQRRRWLEALHQPQMVAGEVANVVIGWTGRRMGYGLFAGRDYQAGEYLGVYTGRLLKRTLSRSNVSDYSFRVPTGAWHLQTLMIDAEHEGNEMRFINHSTDPNVESIGLRLGNLVQIVMRTAAPVKRGSQFFCDYGVAFWKSRR